MAEKFVPNFKTKYINEVVPALQKDFAFKTPMQIPKLEKITENTASGLSYRDGCGHGRGRCKKYKRRRRK